MSLGDMTLNCPHKNKEATQMTRPMVQLTVTEFETLKDLLFNARQQLGKHLDIQSHDECVGIELVQEAEDFLKTIASECGIQ